MLNITVFLSEISFYFLQDPCSIKMDIRFSVVHSYNIVYYTVENWPMEKDADGGELVKYKFI